MKIRFDRRILIFILILITAGEIFFLASHRTSLGKKNIKQYADEIIKKCSSYSRTATCYDKEIPKLMDFISMEDAFEVTKIVQDQDKSYPYCHVLGHNLSAREVDKDPSKWKEVVSRCPSGMCSNGCIHGGFQERFRAESLTDEQIEQIKPDLKTICEDRPNWHPTGLEQASCYHALGHLTMYLTAADINKALNLCKELSVKDDGRDLSQLCFDGSFMQIFQPLEPEDFALIKGKEVTKDQADTFCSRFSGSQKGSCISESWPLFRGELISDPKKLILFCSRDDKNEQDRCYSALFYVLAAQFQFDSNTIKTYCTGLPAERMGQCFANAASRFIETDYRNIGKSVDLCNQADKLGQGDRCFSELLLYSTYNFHKGSEGFQTLCSSLPGAWKEKCFSKGS